MSAILPAALPVATTPRPGAGGKPAAGQPAAPQPSLAVRTFGHPGVEVGGRPVQWHAASAQELFFYLLSFPEGRTRGEILEDLWGLEATPASGNRFRVTLHRVRTALGSPGALTEAYGRYHLAPAVIRASDVGELYRALHLAEHAATPPERLQAYRRVLEVYRGEYLPQVRAEWVREAREEHRAAYVHACLEISALRCEAADCAAAVTDLARALRADPYLGENHHQRLIACLSVVGGPYAATEHYRRFLRFLRDDLNDTPMPETVALAERIKAGEHICPRAQGSAAAAVPPHACPLLAEGRCPAGLRDLLHLN